VNGRALIAGSALVVATNAVLLLGAAYNRSGEPESVLPLTERELEIVTSDWVDRENAMIELRFVWRVPHRPGAPDDLVPDFDVEWLHMDKLRELGFDVSQPLDSEDAVRDYEKELPRDVLLVLENDGPAYRQAVEEAQRRVTYETDLAAANPGKDEFARRAKDARKSLDREERFASRLFVVDAGRELGALRERYPDRQRYAVVRGRVELIVSGPSAAHDLTGRVRAIDVETVSVPHGDRAVVEPLVHGLRPLDDRTPRYAAIVSFGRRLEPWISSLSPL
jgi:uncharacterized protein DUF4824